MVIDFVVSQTHLLNKVFLDRLVDSVKLHSVPPDSHILYVVCILLRFRPHFCYVAVKSLVEDFLVLDGLDGAITNLDEAFVLDDEATDYV